MQTDACVFEGSPVSLDPTVADPVVTNPVGIDPAVIDPTALAAHADLDLCVRQHVDPIATGEPAALIRGEYLRCGAFGEGLLQRLSASLRIPSVGQLPAQTFARVPVHERGKVQKSALRWDIGHLRTPDPTWPIDRHGPHEVGPDLVLWVLIARVWLVEDRNRPHAPYKTARDGDRSCGRCVAGIAPFDATRITAFPRTAFLCPPETAGSANSRPLAGNTA